MPNGAESFRSGASSTIKVIQTTSVSPSNHGYGTVSVKWLFIVMVVSRRTSMRRKKISKMNFLIPMKDIYSLFYYSY